MLIFLFMVFIAFGLILVILEKKRGKKTPIWFAVILFGLIAAFAGLLSLLWLEGKRKIPFESSYFSFRVNLNSSGGYWLYGEDSDNYYTRLGEIAQSHEVPEKRYQVLAKENAAKIFDFDPLNYKTWRETPVECGDLLKRYGHEIPNVHYVSCAYGNHSQKLAVVEYRVSGANSHAVEEILTQKYKMGKLVFTCCYWGPRRTEYGSFPVPELEEINPPYGISLEMFGDAFDDDGGPYLREDIEFTVLVTVWDV